MKIGCLIFGHDWWKYSTIHDAWYAVTDEYTPAEGVFRCLDCLEYFE